MKTATVPLLAMGALFAAIYWMGRQKKKKAEGLQICKVDFQTLDQWGQQAEVAVYYFPNTPKPETLAVLIGQLTTITADVSAGREIVAVMQDDSFWLYDTDKLAEPPKQSLELKASYCDFATR